jgi:glucokinase
MSAPASGPSILGFDIGGTKTALVLGTMQGQVLRRTEFATPARQSFAEAMRLFRVETGRFLAGCSQAGLPGAQTISVSVGGPLNIAQGILYAPPHLAAWGTAPLKKVLEEMFSLPVQVEHDGNAGALAEWKFGAGKGARNLIFLTLGTGLGAGIVIDNHIFHGATDTAGEVGHMRIAPDGPKQYGKAGSWEGYCSGAGMVQLAQLYRPERWNEQTPTREIVTLALAGDADARAVVRQMGEWLGKGLAVLIDVLNPEVIVLGTLGVALGDLLIQPAAQMIAQEALPAPAAACRIVPAALGKSLGDVASLMAVIVQSSQNGQPDK